MANQTVYPYGTGGELPSSIGIINDLTTGGVNKALSAEMGKTLNGNLTQLGQEIIEYVSVNMFDPSEFQYNKRLNGNGNVVSNNDSRGMFNSGLVPVKEGVKYTVSGDGVRGTIQGNTYFKGSYFGSGATGAVGDTCISTVSFSASENGVGRSFTVPTGQNIAYVIISLYRTDTSTDAPAGDTMMNTGGSAIPYQSFSPVPYIKEELIPESYDEKIDGKIATAIDESEERVFGDVSFSKSGYIDPSTGALTSGGAWKSTDYIPILAGDSVNVYNYGTGTVTAAFYDKNKTFISASAGGSTSLRTVTAPTGTCYFRSSNDPTNNPAPYIKVLAVVYEQVVKAFHQQVTLDENQVKANNIDPYYPIPAESATIQQVLTNKFYSQAKTGYVISETTYNALGSMAVENVEVGKRYFLKIGQEIPVESYRNYFIFAKSTTEAVITASEIQNYVELFDNTEHIYIITIPENCTRVYTAGYVSTFPTFWVKDFGERTLHWLSLERGNLSDALFDEIKKSIKDDTIRLFDSIKKPITFNGKNLAAFGDSITQGVSSPGLVNAGENKYISLFCAHVGATLNNKAKSGACITDGANSIESIYTTLTTWTGSADIIWIAGGVNDWQEQATIGSFDDAVATTLYGALNLMCAWLKTNHPNAVVIFVTPIPTTSTTTFGVTHPDNLNDYRRAIQEVAAKNGYNVVNGDGLGLPDSMTPFGNIMFDPSDKLHPTLAGHAMYFRSLCGKLL